MKMCKEANNEIQPQRIPIIEGSHHYHFNNLDFSFFVTEKSARLTVPDKKLRTQ